MGSAPLPWRAPASPCRHQEVNHHQGAHQPAPPTLGKCPAAMVQPGQPCPPLGRALLPQHAQVHPPGPRKCTSNAVCTCQPCLSLGNAPMLQRDPASPACPQEAPQLLKGALANTDCPWEAPHCSSSVTWPALHALGKHPTATEHSGLCQTTIWLRQIYRKRKTQAR